GRLDSYTDANGNRSSFSFDAALQTESIINALGFRTDVTLDEFGNPVRQVGPLGDVTVRTFDAGGFLTSMTDSLGRTTSLVNNAFGEIIKTVDPKGGVSYAHRDSSGSVTSTVSPGGRVLKFGYDSNGNQVSFADPLGLSLTIAHDRSGKPTTFSGAGTVDSVRVNRFGFVDTQHDRSGLVTTHVFDNIGQVVQSIQNIGGSTEYQTSYQYDASGRLVQMTDPDGGVTRYTYDLLGNMIAQTSPLNQVTKYVYDARGKQLEIIYPDNTSSTDSDNPRRRFEYDAVGQLTKEIDERGNATSYLYDAMGRLTVTLLPDSTPLDDSDNPRLVTRYDLVGQVVEEIDARGFSTHYVYDELGNLIRRTTPDGAILRLEYSIDSQKTAETDPLGQITTYQYDSAGRLVSVLEPGGRSFAIEASANADKVAVTTPRGQDVLLEKDNADRLVASIDALGASWEYEYDSMNNLTRSISPEGVEVQHLFDWAKRRVRTTFATGQSSSREYDDGGNLIRTVDFDGREISYVYDARNRPIQKIVQGGETINYTYDVANNLTSITDSRGTLTLVYDERNRLVSQADPQSGVIGYAYDSNGNVTQLTHAGRVVTYSWDAMNRLTTVSIGTQSTSYVYDALGRMIELQYPNGLREQYAYGVDGRLSSVNVVRNAAIVSTREYTYAASGAITQIVQTEGVRVDTSSFEYDANGQLIQESHGLNGVPIKAIQYRYDRDGNRIEKVEGAERITYRYDANGWLSESLKNGVRTVYSYDQAGRLVSKATDGAPVTRYTWNALNRLTSVDLDGDGNAEIRYRYDDFGDLVEKNENGVLTLYTVSRLGTLSQVLLERSGSEETFSVYGVELIARQHGAETVYQHTDALGTAVMTSDQTGTIQVQRYDAFGNALNVQADGRRFHDMEYNDESGMYFARARHYSPELGRFISPDQLPGMGQIPQTQNRFTYSHNNPTNLSDPSGYSPLIEQQVVNGIRTTQASFKIVKTVKVARERGELAAQLGWFVGAAVSYYMFDLISQLRNGEFKPPGKVSIDIFEYKWSKDLWMMGFKISASRSGRKYEFDLGKLPGSDVGVKVFLAFCGTKFCGGGGGLEYTFREIPETGDGKGLFLSIKAYAGLVANSEYVNVPLDVNFSIKFNAFSTFKYEFTIFSGEGLLEKTKEL
ncbi:MAG: RHS repeat-associated core domain-containing protein, partial [Pirellulaceae bacterium]|nr:RHS repeat-associated core domain-containing protein [Pirellulaceae bacterium]